MSRSCHSATFSIAGNDGAAHHAGKAGEVFGQHRVALVRHRRRALLPGREIFLRLQHFGALQVADFDREPFDRRGDHAQRREEHRVAIARDHLRRNRLEGQAQLFGDIFLDRGIDIGEGADRAGNRAGGDVLRAPRSAAPCSAQTRHRPPPASGRRWSARHGCRGCGRWSGYFVLQRAALDRGEQRIEIVEQQSAACASCTARRGVEHVGAGHALMHEARFSPTCSATQVRKAITSCLVTASIASIAATSIWGWSPTSPTAPLPRVGTTPSSPSFGGVRLDLEPDCETGFGLPDRDHRGAGVAGDHGAGFLQECGVGCAVSRRVAQRQKANKKGRRNRAALVVNSVSQIRNRTTHDRTKSVR